MNMKTLVQTSLLLSVLITGCHTSQFKPVGPIRFTGSRVEVRGFTIREGMSRSEVRRQITTSPVQEGNVIWNTNGVNFTASRWLVPCEHDMFNALEVTFGNDVVTKFWFVNDINEGAQQGCSTVSSEGAPSEEP